MQKKWTIRAAGETDGAIVLQLIKELAEYEKLAHDVTATQPDIEKTLLRGDSTARCLLAFVDEKPAGIAVFFQNYSTFKGNYGIYLEDVFVRPEFRRLGLGRGLLDEVINVAKLNNCRRVEWSVLDWNKPAIDFYETLGAKPAKEWVRFRLPLD